MEVIWSRSALQQVLEIHDFIARQNPGAARRLLDSLVSAGDSLTAFPHRGRPAADNTRELVIRPYVIRYEVIDEQVVILRVRDSRRRGEPS